MSASSASGPALFHGKVGVNRMHATSRSREAVALRSQATTLSADLLPPMALFNPLRSRPSSSPIFASMSEHDLLVLSSDIPRMATREEKDSDNSASAIVSDSPQWRRLQQPRRIVRKGSSRAPPPRIIPQWLPQYAARVVIRGSSDASLERRTYEARNAISGISGQLRPACPAIPHCPADEPHGSRCSCK